MRQIAIDVGSGFTKAKTNDRQIVFPSSVGRVVNLHESICADDEPEAAGIIRFKGLEFATGSSAEKLLRPSSRFNTCTPEWAKSQEYRAMMYRAIAECYPGGICGRLRLCTGLPIAFMSTKDFLKSELAGKHKFTAGKHHYDITVDKEHLAVLPQAVGLYLSSGAQKEGIEGYIDVGTFTTGYVAFHDGKLVRWASSGVEVGVSTIAEGLRKYVAEIGGTSTIDKAILMQAITTRRLHVNGADHDISGAIVDISIKQFEDAVRRIAETWSELGSSIKVFVGGGGRDLFLPAIKRKYMHATVTDGEAIFGVVGGYFSAIQGGV